MGYADEQGYSESWAPSLDQKVLWQLLIMSPCLDLLDSSKIWPRVSFGGFTVLLLSPEGQRVGMGVLRKISAFGPTRLNQLHAALWVLTFGWWWRGRWRNSSPLWIIFLAFLGYGFFAASLTSNIAPTVFDVPGLLSAEECAQVISAAEAFGEEYGWTTGRHGEYSTEDIPVTAIPELNSTFLEILVDRLAPVTSRHFGGILEPVDSFVVRYTEDGQTRLKAHQDAGQATFSVVLSDLSDYEGGGVRFPLMPMEDAPLMAGVDDDREPGRIVRAPRGNVLLHDSKLMHEGMEVTKGTRYLLISFSKVRYDNLWHMFMNFHGSLGKENHLSTLSASELRQRSWLASGDAGHHSARPDDGGS